MIDYPIGTVADIVAKSGHTCRAIRRSTRWGCSCGSVFPSADLTSIRPLLVLDPADLPGRATAEALRQYSVELLERDEQRGAAGTLRAVADALDALPPVTEPESLTDDPGHGVVVVDRDRDRWIKFPGTGCWVESGGELPALAWADLDSMYGPLRLAEDGAE